MGIDQQCMYACVSMRLCADRAASVSIVSLELIKQRYMLSRDQGGQTQCLTNQYTACTLQQCEHDVM
eukprot:19234-Heterococcus_DN1.PRE.1